MRKQDYELLAQLIKVLVAVPGEPARQVSELAKIFANHAHVDRAAFLRACGIAP